MTRLTALACLGVLAAAAAANAQQTPPPATVTPAGVTPPAATPPTAATPGAAAPATGSNAPPPAFDIRTMTDLVNVCATPKTSPYYVSAASLCAGYASGVLDYHMLDTVGTRRKMRRVCINDPVPTRSQIIAQFLSFAQTHPQYASEPAANGLMRFFIVNYPCNKSGPP